MDRASKLSNYIVRDWLTVLILFSAIVSSIHDHGPLLGVTQW